ncbi:MAG: lipid biosynthesis B12-binding/radical SAM protein [Desulfobacterales bacterium]
MRVLLVSANTLTRPYPVYPLGLDYVAGALAERHAVQIVDMNLPDAERSLAETVAGFAPEVIGVSIRNIDTSDVADPRDFCSAHRTLVDFIRARSRAPLVLGGSGFTIFPLETLRALDADYGVVGEGERLGGLLDALESGNGVTGMPGVITWESPALLPPPWPLPPVRRFNPHLPHVAYYLKNGGMLNLQTKRGCRFHCIYCTYPHIEGRTQRLFDPQAVAETAIRLQEAGARYFFVTDSAFNASIPHSLAVARAFSHAGVSIPWGAFFAPTEVDRDYFRHLADAGLRHVEFGTESLSDPVLAAYRKPFCAAGVFSAHAAAVDAGLHVAHYLLLGGPGETSDTVEETLARAEALQRCVLFFFCGMRIYPQTELLQLARTEGQADEFSALLAPVFYRPGALDHAEIIRRVRARAGGRLNWVIGDGGEQTAAVISRLYARGHTGPLWEHLAR